MRVLAVDQTYKQEKDTKTVTAKSATLELTPGQAEAVSRAALAGVLSLALRPLGDQGEVASLEDKLKNAKDEFRAGIGDPLRHGPQRRQTSAAGETPVIAATHRNLFVTLALVLAAPLAVPHALAKPADGKPAVDEAGARVVTISTRGGATHQRLVLPLDKARWSSSTRMRAM